MVAVVLSIVLGLPEPDLKPAEAQVAVRQLAKSTSVQILNPGKGAQGSGVVVGRRGAFIYVLTAAHVVAAAKDQLQIRLAPNRDGKAVLLRDVEVLASGVGQDVAIVRVSVGESFSSIAPLAATDLPGADDEFDALSSGFGDAAEPSLRSERVLGKKLLRRTDGKTAFAWECRDRPDTGRSGGPLFDRRGRVIGICSGTQDGKGYYAHTDEILALLKKNNLAWLYRESGEK